MSAPATRQYRSRDQRRSSIGATLAGSSGATTGSHHVSTTTRTALSAVRLRSCPTGLRASAPRRRPATEPGTRAAGYTPDLHDRCGGTRRSPATQATTRRRARAAPAWRRPRVKTGQTISFTLEAPAAAKVGGATYTAAATATSGSDRDLLPPRHPTVVHLERCERSDDHLHRRGHLHRERRPGRQRDLQRGAASASRPSRCASLRSDESRDRQRFRHVGTRLTPATRSRSSGTIAIQLSSVCSTWTLVSQTVVGRHRDA